VAGVHPQDILLGLNSEATNVRFPEELAPVRKRIADLPIGSKADLTISAGEDAASDRNDGTAAGDVWR